MSGYSGRVNRSFAHLWRTYLVVYLSQTIKQPGLKVYCHSSSNAAFSLDTAVLNAKEFARRWRDCNRFSQPPYANAEDEDSWRKHNLEVLSKAHTLGGIKDLGFELVGSHYAVSPESLAFVIRSFASYR